MDNNIVDFNAFKKKKEESEKKKSSSFNDEFYDDDEEFEDLDLDALFGSSQNTNEPSIGDLGNSLDVISDILFEKGDEMDAETYEQQIAEELEALEDEEPSPSKVRAHADWEEERTYLQQKLFLNRIVEIVMSRSDADDAEIAKLIETGELKESDFLLDTGTTIANDLPALMDYYKNLTQNETDSTDPDKGLRDLRKMSYSLIRAIDNEYEQLLREEPPKGNTLMHTRWSNAIAENRQQRRLIRLAKGGVLFAFDFLSDLNSNNQPDYIKDLIASGVLSANFNGDDDYWADDDDDDDWDEDDDDDFWDDDYEGWEDEADDWYNGDDDDEDDDFFTEDDDDDK